MRGTVANVSTITAVLVLSAWIHAQHGDHMHNRYKKEIGSVSPHDPPIKITINPEARVSVAMAGTLPPLPCGTAADLGVKIINYGFSGRRTGMSQSNFGK